MYTLENDNQNQFCKFMVPNYSLLRIKIKLESVK